MTSVIVQLGIAAFGLTALWMAMGHNVKQRKWAPVVGLVGQVFWTAFAWQTKAWGIAVLVLAYTAVYVRGALIQFRTRSTAPSQATSSEVIVEAIARQWDGCMAPMFDAAGNPTDAIDIGATIRADGVPRTAGVAIPLEGQKHGN